MFRALCAAVLCGLATAAPAIEPVIPYSKHSLPNGLTLLVHEDHKAPIVAVNVWYKVGSRDEQPGRTGFAHLFEHLMFKGSAHHDAEYFRPLEAVGAASMNGTTSSDRTNYFQTVPSNALDLALWLESDRMGHLLPALTQAKLDAEREIVLNEKRDGEDQPLGKLGELIARASYPAGHPYSWTAIGAEADLKAATLDEVRQWFTAHYGAANAVLVVAGDVDTADVVKKVGHYFGDIAPGPAQTRDAEWTARMSGTRRIVTQDRITQTRLSKLWNVPGFCTQDANLLSVVADTLAGSKNARLYERLVYRERLATSVSAGLNGQELGSQFTIDATVAPGIDPAQVERVIDEELARLLREGPSQQELALARTAFEAAFLRGLERVDGFSGKSAVLAEYEGLCGRADWYQQEFRWVAQAAPNVVREVARRWLADGALVLRVDPIPDYEIASAGADRTRLPAVSEPPPVRLPPLQRARLSNGIEVQFAKQHGAPVVQLVLAFEAGHAADPLDRPGLASLTLDLLDEGAGRRDALAFARRKEELAADISASSDLDLSYVMLDSLRDRLPDSLELVADLVRRPRFEPEEFERLRARRVTAVRRETEEGLGVLSRLYPALLFGAQHPYAQPASGLGTEASLQAMRVEDVRAFHARWLRPDNLKLLVVGDLTLAQLVPMLERAFGSWTPPASTPRGGKTVPPAPPPTGPRVYLINKPDAGQSTILGVQLAPPLSDPDDLAMNLVLSVLGELYNSRLNMNLREDKHWSYGASASLSGGRVQRTLMLSAQVQQDRTADSLRELVKELHDLRGPRPLSAPELRLAVDNLVHALPVSIEASDNVASCYLHILEHGLPETYFNAIVPQALAITPAQVHAAAQRLIRPEQMIWLVAGDAARIEAPLRALGLGELRVLKSDGRPRAAP